MARTPEGAVLKLVTDYLSAQKIWHRRINTGAVTAEYKGRSRFIRYGSKGMADILATESDGCGMCEVFWLEVKAPNGKQSPDQKAFQQEVENHGMKYLVVRNLEDLKNAGL